MPPLELDHPIVADLAENAGVEGGLRARVMPETSLGTYENEPVQVGKALDYLGQVTRCSAAGILLAGGPRLRIVLSRPRPVDDLFLVSMQQRLLSSYQVYAGAVAADFAADVTVYGRPVAGPYEPLRSLLVVPALDRGHIQGMLAIASVFADAFGGQDLCVLSAVAAQLPVLLGTAVMGDVKIGDCACTADSGQGTHERELRSRVRQHVTSICGLARSWQMQDESDLPEVLRQDLDAIAENALQIRELLAR